LDIFIELNANGDIRVRSNMISPVSIKAVETIVYNVVNPIIIKINKTLAKSGYKMRRFDSLIDENIEVINLKYQSSIQSKAVNFKKVLGCLTSMFDVMDTDLDVNKGIVLNFIRVDNYQKMNAIAATITEVFKRTNSQAEIIETLSTNFSLSRDAAMAEIVNYFNQHQRIHGQFVNKQVDIVDNPGFPVSIYKSPFDNKLQIKVDQINAIEFIEIIHIYLFGKKNIIKQKTLAICTLIEE
jgi:ribosomal protein S17E